MLATERTNQQWLLDLTEPGPQRDTAIADLRTFLARGLRYALSGRTDVDSSRIEDFAQDALLNRRP